MILYLALPTLMGRAIRHDMKNGGNTCFKSLNETSVKVLKDQVHFSRMIPEYAFSKDYPDQSYFERAL